MPSSSATCAAAGPGEGQPGLEADNNRQRQGARVLPAQVLPHLCRQFSNLEQSLLHAACLTHQSKRTWPADCAACHAATSTTRSRPRRTPASSGGDPAALRLRAAAARAAASISGAMPCCGMQRPQAGLRCADDARALSACRARSNLAPQAATQAHLHAGLTRLPHCWQTACTDVLLAPPPVKHTHATLLLPYGCCAGNSAQ